MVMMMMIVPDNDDAIEKKKKYSKKFGFKIFAQEKVLQYFFLSLPKEFKFLQKESQFNKIK